MSTMSKLEKSINLILFRMMRSHEMDCDIAVTNPKLDLEKLCSFYAKHIASSLVLNEEKLSNIFSDYFYTINEYQEPDINRQVIFKRDIPLIIHAISTAEGIIKVKEGKMSELKKRLIEIISSSQLGRYASNEEWNEELADIIASSLMDGYWMIGEN